MFQVLPCIGPAVITVLPSEFMRYVLMKPVPRPDGQAAIDPRQDRARAYRAEEFNF